MVKYTINLSQICVEDEKTCEENNYIIDPDFKYTNIVTEFNLFCDRKQYIVIMSTINFFGSMIGGSILSSFAVNSISNKGQIREV